MGSEDRAGFTLVEVLVAMAVLSIALVALLSLRNHDLSMQAQAERLITATSLAKLKLEEIRHGNLDGRRGDGGTFDERFSDYRWVWRAEPAPVPAWVELQVEVSWSEGSGTERVTLMTYVPDV
jgi:general secretion pathway protein I